MQKILDFLRWPFDLLVSENGFLGDIWHASDRNKALMLGLPAVLFALGGLVLLTFAQFSVANTLESTYRARLEESSAAKKKYAEELEQEVRMRLATDTAPTENVTLDDLVDPDDPRRVGLNNARDEERIYLQKLNSINPAENLYLFELAKVTIETNQAEGLAMMSKIAPMTEPGYVPAHLFLAKRHLGSRSQGIEKNRQKIAAAIRHIDHALKREPKNAEALRMKFVVLYRMKKLAEAYDVLEVLVEQKPEMYRSLVDINKRLNRENESVPVLTAAVSHFRLQLRDVDYGDEKRMVVIRELGNCYMLQKDFEKAERLLLEEIDHYAKSTDDASRLIYHKKLLGEVYIGWSAVYKDDNYDSLKAKVALLKQAYAYDSNNPSALRLITRYGSSEYPDIAAECKKIYDPAQHTDQPPSVTNELGIQALSESRYQDALRLFTQAKQRAEKNPEILNNLAYTYLKCETPNPRLALTLVNDAIRFSINSPSFGTYRSNFLDTRGRAYRQLGQLEKAIADFTKAYVDRKEDVGILESLVECCEAGQMDEVVIWRERLEAAKAKQGKQDEETKTLPVLQGQETIKLD